MDMKCKICGKNSTFIFTGKILNKYNISYFYCKNCGFLQTEEPYWLDEAYKVPINITDTGVVDRNIKLSNTTATIIFFFFDCNKKFLDYAGGYGLFTRLMRDKGFDFYWYDPFTPNLFAKGFEYDINKHLSEIEMITTFECFEHFVNPLDEIEKILNISSNIFFTTELLPSPVPLPEQWWYYGLDHGQHISFYSWKTFKFIAKKYKLNLYSNGKYHLLTSKTFNPNFFNFFASIDITLPLEVYIKANLKSKTVSDMEYLKKLRINNNE